MEIKEFEVMFESQTKRKIARALKELEEKNINSEEIKGIVKKYFWFLFRDVVEKMKENDKK